MKRPAGSEVAKPAVEASPKKKPVKKKPGKKEKEPETVKSSPKAKAEKPKPESGSKRGKAELLASEEHGGWQVFKFKRSTSGTPFWKFVGPDGTIYWTRRGAEKAGFKPKEVEA